MPVSRASKILQGLGVSTFATALTFTVFTKHSKWEDISPSSDPVFQSALYKRFNPLQNPTLHDICLRRVPVWKLNPELVEDAQKGGTRLVEAFCAGIWGQWGYLPQRLILSQKYRNDTTTAHQLWSKKQLLASSYNEGTEITDHFSVLSKTSSFRPSLTSRITPPTTSSPSGTIIPSPPASTKRSSPPQPSTSSATGPLQQTLVLRCGDSPLNSPDGPRASDGLFELSSVLDTERGVVEFRMKSVLYQGVPKSETGAPPLEGFLAWAHRRYTELWMELAVRNCYR